MKLTSLCHQNLADEAVTHILFSGLDDNVQTGDCIFVFGSVGTSEERTLKAIELYKQGRAPYILFSGGDRWGKHETTDAHRMSQMALEYGVPKEAILLEQESNQTKENVLASMLVLDRFFGLHRLKRLLIVSAPWHMRRCAQTLRTYMPAWIDYSWCMANCVGQMPDDWTASKDSRRIVRTELDKLIHLIHDGQLADFDV